MKNPFLLIASLFGATAVALGAMGAHALKTKVEEGLMRPDQLAAWDTASKYQIVHAVALLFIYLISAQNGSKLLKATGWLFTIGVIFFSGSIYLLSTQGISNMSFRFLGPVTPLGGVCMIAGWVCLLLFAIQSRKEIK